MGEVHILEKSLNLVARGTASAHTRDKPKTELAFTVATQFLIYIGTLDQFEDSVRDELTEVVFKKLRILHVL